MQFGGESGHAPHAGAGGACPVAARGRWQAVRGTSFAAPLVAARVAAMKDAGKDAGKDGAAFRPALDREARDLGAKGPDAVYGRGLLCGNCRPR